MDRKPKFNIGDTVYNTVERRGSYEPSVCHPHERMKVEEVSRHGNTFEYTCGYDGYVFKESELMSPQEYADSIVKKG